MFIEQLKKILNSRTGKDLSFETFKDSSGAIVMTFKSVDDAILVRDLLKKPTKEKGFGCNSIEFNKTKGNQLTIVKKRNKEAIKAMHNAIAEEKDVVSVDMLSLLTRLKDCILGFFAGGVSIVRVNYDEAAKSVSFNLQERAFKEGKWQDIIRKTIPNALETSSLNSKIHASTGAQEKNKNFIGWRFIYLTSPEQITAAEAFIKANSPASAGKAAAPTLQPAQAKPSSDGLKLADGFTLWQIGEVSEANGMDFKLEVKLDLGKGVLHLIQTIASHYSATITVGERARKGKKAFVISNVPIENTLFPLEVLAKQYEKEKSYLEYIFKDGGFGLRKHLTEFGAISCENPRVGPKTSGWTPDYAGLANRGNTIRIAHKNMDLASRSEPSFIANNMKSVAGGLDLYGCVFRIEQGKAPHEYEISIRADLSILALIGSVRLGGHEVPDGWWHSSKGAFIYPEPATNPPAKPTPAPAASTPANDQDHQVPKPDEVNAVATEEQKGSGGLASKLHDLLVEEGYVHKPEENGFVHDPANNGWTKNEQVSQNPQLCDINDDDLRSEWLKRLGITIEGDSLPFIVITTERKKNALEEASSIKFIQL